MGGCTGQKKSTGQKLLAVMVEEFKMFKTGKSPFGVLVEDGEQLRKKTKICYM